MTFPNADATTGRMTSGSVSFPFFVSPCMRTEETFSMIPNRVVPLYRTCLKVL